MNNQERRELLEFTKAQLAQGIPVSVMDVFTKGPDAAMQMAVTPQQQEQGLRPHHQAGNTQQSMVFPNVQPNTKINTKGLQAPINIKTFDQNDHLVKSYENVPPGMENLPIGKNATKILETPSNENFI